MLLDAERVVKNFGGLTAVNRVTLQVEAGQIVGLIGPNGAGKTTTLRMIMDILRPDAGRILVLGSPIDDGVKDRIGYLPEERGVYRKMRVGEFFQYVARLKGVDRQGLGRRVEDWRQRLELVDVINKRCQELSKGMQQKVQFIGTVIHEPELLILDEPFSGLDPINTRDLKDLLLEMSREGVTVVLSTHVLPQVDELCSDICLINRARPILLGSLDRIRSDYGGNTWRVRSDLPESELADLPGVTSVHPLGDERVLELEDGREPRDLLRALVDRSQVESFTRFIPDLENIFIRAVEEDRAHG